MLFSSLPPSLLALVFALLEGQALAGPSPSPTTHFGNVGDYVAHGLGINNGSASPTNDYGNDTPSLATTGTGLEYASKCADALNTWSSSSLEWQWDNAIVRTSTFSSGFTETLRRPGTTKATSVITLCDGHPRVVGHISVSQGGEYTSTVAWTNTITKSEANHDYPTPTPCSIQPSDCKALSSSYDSSLSRALAEKGFATGQGPLCTVTPSSTISRSYSTNAKGGECDNCMIAAHTARVMFWPVTTAAGGNLCNNTASTITSSPTGPPNSFVTEGITITSPTVAISLAYMSRVDGCGTTINHTIIPVRPEEVTSVRGFRALFEHHRFNFADLNYYCMDTNTTNVTIADGLGESCYQQVPAAAYFGGLNNAVVLDQAPFRNMSKEQMTIWDNYQPQLLPPRTMTQAITSLWGEDCIIHPDGVWDPPIALTPEPAASVVVPTYPGGGSTTEKDEPEKTPASPINSYGPVPPRKTGITKPERPPTEGDSSENQHFTALPDTVSGGSSDGENGGKSNEDGSSHNDPSGSSDGDNGGKSNEDGSSHNDPSGSSDGDNGGKSNEDGSSHNDPSGSSDGDNGGKSNEDGSSYDDPSGSSGSSGSNGSGSTHDQGDQAGDQEGQSTGSSNENGQGTHGGNRGSSSSGQVTEVHTTVIIIGNKVLQCTQDSNGAWIIPDASTTHAASSGGSAVEIDAATLTAGPHGLSTVHADVNVLTIGNKVMTCTQNSDGAWVIPDSSTKHTVSEGGSAVEVDGVTLTAGSEGLVTAHASKTGDSSSEDSSEDSTSAPGATQTNRAQSTGATGSEDASSATRTGESGGSTLMGWKPFSLAIAAVAVCFCVL